MSLKQMKINFDLKGEKALIGICLCSEKHVMRACQILTPEMFSDLDNRAVFGYILEIYNEGSVVDFDSLMARMRVKGTFDSLKHNLPKYDELAVQGHFNTHLKNIQENYRKFRIAELINRLAEDYENKSIEEIFLECQRHMTNGEAVETHTFQSIIEGEFFGDKNFESWIRKRKKLYDEGYTITGLSTGFFDLDNKINGLNPAHYTVIGGRPGSGKTTFALQIMRHLLRNGSKCGFLSFEMLREQALLKFLSDDSKYPFSKIIRGDLKADELESIISLSNELKSNPNLFLQDVPVHRLSDLRARMKYLVRVKGCKVIFIDYLTLMSSDVGNSEHEKIAAISKEVKHLLVELKVPGIVVCQLTKDSGTDNPPRDNEIYGSAEIAKNAYDILLLHPDRLTGDRQLWIRKNRFGPIDIPINYTFENGIFEEATEQVWE